MKESSHRLWTFLCLNTLLYTAGALVEKESPEGHLNFTAIWLPEAAEQYQAKCLDGSPPVYYWYVCDHFNLAQQSVYL